MPFAQHIHEALQVIPLASLLCLAGREKVEEELLELRIEPTKKEILSAMKKGEEISFEKLCDDLDISPKIIIIAIKQLEEEGTIRAV